MHKLYSATRANDKCRLRKYVTLIENERAKRTHCCTLIDIFVYIIYSVTKTLCKIRATTFTEKYGKLRELKRDGG